MNSICGYLIKIWIESLKSLSFGIDYNATTNEFQVDFWFYFHLNYQHLYDSIFQMTFDICSNK